MALRMTMNARTGTTVYFIHLRMMVPILHRWFLMYFLKKKGGFFLPGDDPDGGGRPAVLLLCQQPARPLCGHGRVQAPAQDEDAAPGRTPGSPAEGRQGRKRRCEFWQWQDIQ